MNLLLIILFSSNVFNITNTPWQEVKPAVSMRGRNFIVVYQDNRDGDWDIYGIEFNENLSEYYPFLVHDDTLTDENPDIATSPNGVSGVVFKGEHGEEGDNGPYYIEDAYFNVIFPHGYVPFENGILVKSGISNPFYGGSWFFNPRISVRGDTFNVVFQEEAYAEPPQSHWFWAWSGFFNTYGEPVGPTHIINEEPVDTRFGATTSSQDRFFVAFIVDTPMCEEGAQRRFLRISCYGNPSTPSFNYDVTEMPEICYYSKEIADFTYGDNYFLYSVPYSDENRVINVIFKLPDTLISKFSIPNARNPSISFTGGKFFIFYNDTLGNIRCLKIDPVNPERTGFEGKVILSGEGYRSHPDVVFDGEKFLVVFDMDDDIYGAFVDTSLNVEVAETWEERESWSRLSSNITNGDLQLSLHLEKESHVEVTIFDPLGRGYPLLSRNFPLGDISVRLTLPDELPRGIYFISIRVDCVSTVKKLLYIGKHPH